MVFRRKSPKFSVFRLASSFIRIVKAIPPNGPITIDELCKEARTYYYQGWKVIKFLEDKGYVRRTKKKQIKFVELTPEGRKFREDLLKLTEEIEAFKKKYLE